MRYKPRTILTHIEVAIMHGSRENDVHLRYLGLILHILQQDASNDFVFRLVGVDLEFPPLFVIVISLSPAIQGLCGVESYNGADRDADGA